MTPSRTPDLLPNAGSVALAHIDRAGKIVRANAAWATQWLGDDFLAACRDGSDLELVAFADDVARIIAGTTQKAERTFARCTATDVRWFRAEATPIADGVAIVCADVTREHVAEAMLDIQMRVTRLLSDRAALGEACVDVARAVCNGLAWDVAAVWLNEANGFRGTAVVANANEEKRDAAAIDRFTALTCETVIGEGAGLIGRACETRAPAWEMLSATSTNAREAAAYALGMRVTLVVPFVYDDLVPAAIELCARYALKIDPELVNLLQLAGLHLAGEEKQRTAERRAMLAEQNERKAQAELQAVLACVPAAIAAIDKQGRVLFVNAGWSRDPAELVGKDWRALIPTAEQRDAEPRFMAALKDGATHSYETKRIGGDGRPEWYSTHIGPLRDAEDVFGAVLFVSNISERKSREAEVLEAQKLATVGTIAAGVAHEINNPLAYIMANLDFSSRQIESSSNDAPIAAADKSELLEVLAEARQGAERIHKVVRDLRTFSRSDAEARGEIDVNAVLESTINLAWNEIRHRGRMVKQLGEVPRVVGNEARLGQVFLNLLLNAAQALPEGAHDKHEIRVASEVRDGAVCIDIADTGHGIPPQDLERVFEPFFTTRPAGKGTGLGLTISRTILQGFGGQITVTSEPGKGATFHVRLPLPLAQQAAAAERGADAKSPSVRSRVLIVDDEVAVARALKRFLSAHECELSPSAEHALQRLREGEHFDAVFCDMMMPQMTGAQLHAIVAKEFPSLAPRMIFMTGGAFGGESQAFFERVTNQRLEKPFDAKTVASVLDAVLTQPKS